MRVLFTTPVLEHPAAGGPQLRVENSIKALNRVFELYIVSRIAKHGMGGDEAEPFYRHHCREFLYSPSVSASFKNRFSRGLRKLSGGAGEENDDARFILDVVDKKGIDCIWFGYGNVSFSLIEKIKQMRPGLKVVCDTDSVWSRFVLRELPYETDPERRRQIEKEGKEKEQEEKEWVNLCEVTTAVSEVDARYYRGLAKEPERVKIFSNVIDLASYESTPKAPAGFKKPCMYLAGSFWLKSPMEKAARWVIDDILPIIKTQIPDIHFYIVGKGSKETLADIDDPSITIAGKLPSVLPYLCNANVSLVPLKFESGTRFKILEAGACNVPIVSTTLGAEGIPITDGKDIVLADEPNEFAEGVMKIIRDQEFAGSLAAHCRDLIQQYYSVDSLAEEAQEILKYLDNVR